MPSSKRPSSSERGDIWRRQENRIRKLYKSKTVDNVKRILEEEEDFPELALSTWIEKLGELGIRKNVSSQEWRKIYQHIIPRLEDPARPKGDLKLKRTKTSTEVIIRGRKYTWDQAWKNMKSAKAIGQLPRSEGTLSPLPLGFMVRTPPPTSPPVLPASREGFQSQATRIISTLRNRATSTGHALVCRAKSNPADGKAMPLVKFDHFGSGSNETMADYVERVWTICLAGLPIGNVIHCTIEIANLATPSGACLQESRQDPNLMFQLSSLPSAINTAGHEASSEVRWNLAHQFMSAVFGESSNDLTVYTSHSEHYIELFTIIYLLSNRLESYGPSGSLHEGLFRNLDLIFATVPSGFLQDLLHSRLASIRAAFEALLMLSGSHKQPRAFEFLVEAGAIYGWLKDSRNVQDLLTSAVSMELIQALQTLLENGFRPDSMFPHIVGTGPTPAIVEALLCEDFHSAQLLLKYCDVNEAIGPTNTIDSAGMTNFDYFFLHLDGRRDLFEHGLELFIQAGANLDADASVFRFRKHPKRGPEQTWAFSGHAWPHLAYAEDIEFSFLDYLFYIHRPLFHKFSWKSARVQCGRLHRAGVLLALEGGPQDLEHYLDNLRPQVSQQWLTKFFEQLIVDQFLCEDLQHQKKATDMEIVHGLVSFGVNMKKVLRHFPHLLEDLVGLIGTDCPKEEVEAVQYLLDNGATVNGDVFSWMALLPEKFPLDLARSDIVGTRELGTAVILAALSNDFEAIERLLRYPTDLEADIWRDYHRRLSIIAHVIYSWGSDTTGLPRMVDFLVKKGAPLRLSARRAHPYYLLQFIMHVSWEDSASFLGIVRYVVDSGHDLPSPSFQSASLLESYSGLIGGAQNFQYLLKKGGELPPGSSMATWIGMAGGFGLVQEMLEAGALVNAYFGCTTWGKKMTALQTAAELCRADVVELLLEAGADVNAPARGLYGSTALQAACGATATVNDGAVHATPSEMQRQKLRIIALLLDHGADVNAAPARSSGFTALQEAASVGDLAIAKLLLFRQPMADVNAPPCQRECDRTHMPTLTDPGTALDLAARHGRIDMVKLLLNCNALSHHRLQGETGYDGAIYEAEKQGHLAVADLIRQHARDAVMSDTENPYLSQPARDWREYGYELGPDEDSEDSGWERESKDDTDSEAETDSSDESDLVTPSDINTQDPSDAAHDLDIHNSAQPPAHDESPCMAAAHDDNIWEDQGDLSLGHEGDVTAMGHPLYSVQNVDLDAFMGFDVSEDVGRPTGFRLNFDSETRQSTGVRDADSWVLETEGMDGFASIGPFERLIEEVDEDSELLEIGQ